ncbi:MAG: nucleotidyltransferase domain-containing protein [Proteobacteria bacterium]|jgi:predicted nucleotidyltransferase|nr:nucleotidyltransferase domain-containing protein [Pseudomonadota bacterium]
MSGRFGLMAADVDLLMTQMRQLGLRGKVFGSRVRGTEKKFSDLDLCILGNVALTRIGQLQEALEASGLPIVVDVSRYEDLHTNFQALVDREGVLIPDA